MERAYIKLVKACFEKHGARVDLRVASTENHALWMFKMLDACGVSHDGLCKLAMQLANCCDENLKK